MIFGKSGFIIRRRRWGLIGIDFTVVVKDPDNVLLENATVELREFIIGEYKTEENFNELLETFVAGAGDNITAGTDTTHKYSEDASLHFETHGTGESGYAYVEFEFDLTNAEELSFYYDATGSSDTWRRPSVKINGTEVWYTDSDPSDWEKVEIDVTGYEGVCSIQFGYASPNGTGQSGHNLWYDNIFVRVVSDVVVADGISGASGEVVFALPEQTYQVKAIHEDFRDVFLNISPIDEGIYEITMLTPDPEIDDCVEVNEAEIGVEDITWQEIIAEEEEQFEEQEATIGVENISWEEVV